MSSPRFSAPSRGLQLSGRVRLLYQSKLHLGAIAITFQLSHVRGMALVVSLLHAAYSICSAWECQGITSLGITLLATVDADVTCQGRSQDLLISKGERSITGLLVIVL